MRRQYIADMEGVFSTYVYDTNRRKIVPTSATITVYKPASITKVVDAGVMTVAGDGLLSYSLTATHNDILGENYKAVITYIYATISYSETFFYDVVIAKLTNIITDIDIVNELPQLKDNGWRVHGTADSGNTMTIVDAELKRYEDDYFTNGVATNLTNDEMREITDFVSSTGTVTIVTATATAAVHKYILRRAYRAEIQRAFEKIEELIIRAGHRPNLILDPYDLREVHICYSVAEVCKGLTGAGGTDTFWWQMWKDYEAKAYAIFKSITFKYDESNDGVISATEKQLSYRNRTTGRG